MDEKKRNEFDSRLKQCADSSARYDPSEIIEQLLSDPMAEVELV
jgi:hypothetical protein